MGESPSDDGAVHDTLAEVGETTLAVGAVGAPGVVAILKGWLIAVRDPSVAVSVYPDARVSMEQFANVKTPLRSTPVQLGDRAALVAPVPGVIDNVMVE